MKGNKRFSNFALPQREYAACSGKWPQSEGVTLNFSWKSEAQS